MKLKVVCFSNCTKWNITSCATAGDCLELPGNYTSRLKLNFSFLQCPPGVCLTCLLPFNSNSTVSCAPQLHQGYSWQISPQQHNRELGLQDSQGCLSARGWMKGAFHFPSRAAHRCQRLGLFWGFQLAPKCFSAIGRFWVTEGCLLHVKNTVICFSETDIFFFFIGLPLFWYLSPRDVARRPPCGQRDRFWFFVFLWLLCLLFLSVRCQRINQTSFIFLLGLFMNVDLNWVTDTDLKRQSWLIVSCCCFVIDCITAWIDRWMDEWGEGRRGVPNTPLYLYNTVWRQDW